MERKAQFLCRISLISGLRTPVRSNSSGHLLKFLCIFTATAGTCPWANALRRNGPSWRRAPPWLPAVNAFPSPRGCLGDPAASSGTLALGTQESRLHLPAASPDDVPDVNYFFALTTTTLVRWPAVRSKARSKVRWA